MGEFRVARELTVELFDECEVWSEHYDGFELDEILSWGVDPKFVKELLDIHKEGGSHPYYPVLSSETLPDRMRIFILAEFTSLYGRLFKGVICNPEPFLIGIFVNGKIEIFNPNMTKEWNASEVKLRDAFGLHNESIFPLHFQTNFKDCKGDTIEGWYGK